MRRRFVNEKKSVTQRGDHKVDHQVEHITDISDILRPKSWRSLKMLRCKTNYYEKKTSQCKTHYERYITMPLFL